MEYNYLLYPQNPVTYNNDANLSGHVSRTTSNNVSAKMNELAKESLNLNPSIDDTTFVTRLYLGLLGREYEIGGYKTWMNYLKNGKTREWVIDEFLKNPEPKALLDFWGYN